jgi:hypothetical protein
LSVCSGSTARSRAVIPVNRYNNHYQSFAGFGLERPGVVDWSAGIADIDPTVAA